MPNPSTLTIVNEIEILSLRDGMWDSNKENKHFPSLTEAQSSLVE